MALIIHSVINNVCNSEILANVADKETQTKKSMPEILPPRVSSFGVNFHSCSLEDLPAKL